MSVRTEKNYASHMRLVSFNVYLYEDTATTYQHRGTLLEDSVQRSWTATFFRIFVFFPYPEKYGGQRP